jgi:ferrochelatase
VREPFDAVLVVAFGGPLGPDDIRPFLANVLRGRRVTPERVEEVAHHYERFGGVSPLTELTMRQAEGLRERLRARGMPLPVYVGMRNWDPFLKDTLARMSRDGMRRAVGFIAAAQRSYSSCTQYRENVADARAAVRAEGLADVEVTFVDDWHADPGFVEANAANVRDAFAQLPDRVRAAARLIFTAHSIPTSMAERYPYESQLEAGARAVAERVDCTMEAARLTSSAPRGTAPQGAPGSSHPAPGAPGTGRCTWELVYQSRSGRPEDPWLGPDICEHLRAEAPNLEAVVLSPIGFICDHIEVLYDLDVEAADVCRELRIPMVRARAVNDHPLFLEMMADVVMRTVERYRRGHPVSIVPPHR